MCSRTPVVLALLIMSSLIHPAPTLAQTAPANEPVAVVNGEGVVKSAPDRAWVTIGAESRARDPKEAQAQNAKAMSAVHEKLAALGLPKDALRTVGYDLQLEFDWTNGKQVPRGYVARNSLEVRVDDIARVGDVMDAAIGTGATSIHGLRFDLKKRETLEREALRLAWSRRRARRGGRDGRRLHARPHRAHRGGRHAQHAAAPADDDGANGGDEARPSTPVAVGEIEIRAQVTLTVSLK